MRAIEKKNELSAKERTMLDIEKRRWKYPGAKEQAIHKELNLSALAYYQQLNVLIDSARAIEAEPALTRRLREHRDYL